MQDMEIYELQTDLQLLNTTGRPSLPVSSGFLVVVWGRGGCVAVVCGRGVG